jgi:aryl-alcohol dehydrogenase-like predicted oxidoreductase
MEEYLSDDRLGKAERLEEFARAHEHTLLELALSWLASRPAVSTVIAGATTPEQVRANAAATSAWTLTDEELAEIDRIAGAG